MNYYRGDIFYADLGTVMGSEQGGIRPVVIIQNDVGNRHAPTVITVPTTTRTKNPLPTHVSIPDGEGGLPRNSIVLLEQIRTLDKTRLMERLGSLSEFTMKQIDSALLVSVGIA